MWSLKKTLQLCLKKKKKDSKVVSVVSDIPRVKTRPKRKPRSRTAGRSGCISSHGCNSLPASSSVSGRIRPHQAWAALLQRPGLWDQQGKKRKESTRASSVSPLCRDESHLCVLLLFNYFPSLRIHLFSPCQLSGN